MAKRINGEGTYHQRQDGRWEGAAYVLIPDGTYKRRRVYGKTDEEVRQKLTDLKANSDQGIPTEATGWTVGRFLTYWLEQIVKPACKPRTYQGYEVVVRVHLVPALGKKKLNKLTGADVRLFLRRLENMCLCCIHKTDQKRAEGERRCCAVGRCCKSLPSVRLRQQAHAVLRNALEAAVREERAYAGSDWVETGHVFTSVIGTPIEPDNLRRSWYPLREKIGAEGVRFHDLRHTCVT
ncbi:MULTISPECIES: site-specific integrase, partial [unclassified Frankia]|uniref:site-specific integrase n=1 Tax=unclassified Frankia TaxID=2632575 RepID=UPI002AD31AF0